jgi:hypothetical protein
MEVPKRSGQEDIMYHHYEWLSRQSQDAMLRRAEELRLARSARVPDEPSARRAVPLTVLRVAARILTGRRADGELLKENRGTRYVRG